jgi:hypothetical protein
LAEVVVCVDFGSTFTKAALVSLDYVLAAAGLLAAEHPEAAYRLVSTLWLACAS